MVKGWCAGVLLGVLWGWCVVVLGWCGGGVGCICNGCGLIFVHRSELRYHYSYQTSFYYRDLLLLLGGGFRKFNHVASQGNFAS